MRVQTEDLLAEWPTLRRRSQASTPDPRGHRGRRPLRLRARSRRSPVLRLDSAWREARRRVQQPDRVRPRWRLAGPPRSEYSRFRGRHARSSGSVGPSRLARPALRRRPWPAPPRPTLHEGRNRSTRRTRRRSPEAARPASCWWKPPMSLCSAAKNSGVRREPAGRTRCLRRRSGAQTTPLHPPQGRRELPNSLSRRCSPDLALPCVRAFVSSLSCPTLSSCP